MQEEIIEEVKKYINLRYNVHLQQSQSLEADNKSYHKGALRALEDLARKISQLEDSHE